jgi:hypothetical protein
MFAYGPKRRSVALQRYVRSGGEADTPRQWTDAFDPEPTFAQGICNARIWLALELALARPQDLIGTIVL